MASSVELEEGKGAEGNVLAQLHCDEGSGGSGGIVGSPMQKAGPDTVSDMAKNSSTWTVTTTEPAPTARQAGSRPGPTIIGSGSLPPPSIGRGVINGDAEMLGTDKEGTTTVFVATGAGTVAVVGPAPIHEQALSNRYDTSP